MPRTKHDVLPTDYLSKRIRTSSPSSTTTSLSFHSAMSKSPSPPSANPPAPSSKLDIDYLLNSRPGSSVAASTSARKGGRRSTIADESKRKSKERPYECEACGFSFGQRSDRNKHYRTVHLRERPFVCQYCNQTFGEKGNLNKHIRALHEKARPFKCQECPGQFAFHDGLVRHVSMVHREARPFKCADPECDKAFKQKAHAEKHYASVHQKLKPCVCFCGAAFREKYNMKQHQKAVHNMNP